MTPSRRSSAARTSSSRAAARGATLRARWLEVGAQGVDAAVQRDAFRRDLPLLPPRVLAREPGVDHLVESPPRGRQPLCLALEAAQLDEKFELLDCHLADPNRLTGLSQTKRSQSLNIGA